MPAGGTLIRDQPRFGSKRGDADDLLHPGLAPRACTATSPIEKIRHVIAHSVHAALGKTPPMRQWFPLRSAIFALHRFHAHRPYLDKHRGPSEASIASILFITGFADRAALA
jgi:hypothetical protein